MKESALNIWRKSFPAEVRQLDSVMCFIQQVATAVDFASREKECIAIAVEEAFVNIVSYGYDAHVAEAVIELRCHLFPAGFLQITILDQGKPYDVSVVPSVSVHACLEQRTIGGLGLFFIKKMMDEVTYCRQESTNVLILKKYRGQRTKEVSFP